MPGIERVGITTRKDRTSRVGAGMLYEIIEAKALPDYRLWVKFADGKEGEVDLTSFVGKGVFARWEDSREFEKVYIDKEMGTGQANWTSRRMLCTETWIPKSGTSLVSAACPSDNFPVSAAPPAAACPSGTPGGVRKPLER